MTGYAYREIEAPEYSLSVEIRGYNSRFLEIYAGLPPFLYGIESWVRGLLSDRIGRGKVEVSVRFREYGGKMSVSVNTEAARAYQKAIDSLAAAIGTDEKAGLSHILGMEGVLESGRKRDDERYRKLIEPVMREAIAEFESEREREGKHTEEDILAYLSEMEKDLLSVSTFAPSLEESIKENLRSRFAELLGGAADENRVLAETAVLLVKYTISEEISRLSAHFGEFRAETAREGRPGKKLDFLCQEINREINTIGSKTPQLEVSRAVVRMKNALENIREQLRNVE
ncbi:MAG: YicC family protein [Treponema sp.]|jgi:uncharacterized protein (TIGR00255 family)|nr:YicC family protein [Treponema sp.]